MYYKCKWLRIGHGIENYNCYGDERSLTARREYRDDVAYAPLKKKYLRQCGDAEDEKGAARRPVQNADPFLFYFIFTLTDIAAVGGGWVEGSAGSISALSPHRRRHVRCAGMRAPALKTTASRAFPRNGHAVGAVELDVACARTAQAAHQRHKALPDTGSDLSAHGNGPRGAS